MGRSFRREKSYSGFNPRSRILQNYRDLEDEDDAELIEENRKLEDELRAVQTKIMELKNLNQHDLLDSFEKQAQTLIEKLMRD